MTSNDPAAPTDSADGGSGVRHLSATQAELAGWLRVGSGAVISPWALFVPRDRVGVGRSIEVGPGAEVGAFAVLHGGLRLEAETRVEDQVVAGQPEYGYALRAVHPGHGGLTVLGAGSVLRAGAVVYASAALGEGSVLGHQSLLRTGARVGRDCLLGHTLTIERDAEIGDRVRVSPGSHITAETQVGDGVFLGAGVRTVNDNGLDWSPGGGAAPLTPPRFDTAARVGSGAVVLGGVRVGARAVVGAGSVVLRDVAPDTIVAGNPARLLRATGSRS